MKPFLHFIMVIILLSTAFIYARFTETRSMDATTFASIKNALNTDPFLIELKQNLRLTEGEEDLLENMEGERTASFGFTTYRIRTFEFVFNIDTIGWSIIKDKIIAFPVSDTIANYYKTDNSGDNANTRALSLAYVLEHYVLINDLLYYYDDTAYAQAIRDSMAILAAFADTVLRVTEPWGLVTDTINYQNYPEPANGNKRLRLTAALGYAGLVLDSKHFVDYADSHFFECRIITLCKTWYDYNFPLNILNRGGFYNEEILSYSCDLLTANALRPDQLGKVVASIAVRVGMAK